jgi:hypothetical protein
LVKPSLLDLQQSLARCLVTGDAAEVFARVVDDGLSPRERLGIYRNTFLLTASRALKLTFPAVERLVGSEFFEGAAQTFVVECPPNRADLNVYGDEFPRFLERFAPAGTLPYLPDVARLEYAVSRALHAEDRPSLDPAELARLGEADQAQVRFAGHPSISTLEASVPVDAIWRSVLNQDDQAMAAVDLSSGPVHLLVERPHDHVEVSRLDAAAWHMSVSLFEGLPLGLALERHVDADAPAVLAAHLLAGRFISYSLGETGAPS